MSIRTLTLTIAVCFPIATACGSAPQTAETTAANDRNTGYMENNGRTAATSGGDVGGGCSTSPVYFAYNSSDLDARARSALESSARCIQQRDANARITGMTDPRGTEEYNLALGDRRARTVVQYLSNMGVDSSRLSPRSVGEEMAGGQDESGWANDRRADIQVQ